MKRALFIVAFAALAACASRERSYSGGAAPTSATPPGNDQSAVIQPSDLSPEQVRLVQRSLVDRGFAVDLTGSFDDRTQTALMDFQRARGLPATGNLNAPTVEALGIDPRDVMPVRGSSSSMDSSREPTKDDAREPPPGSPSSPSPSTPGQPSDQGTAPAGTEPKY
jgi:Putative peptidoglycan binding domain